MARLVADLETPAVLVDLDVLNANIREMAEVAEAAGIVLRPHMKTHKTPQIARLQMAAGAVGVTCAKVSEAEVMVKAGIVDVFVASPLVSAVKATRLAELARQPGVRASTIVDSAEGVAALSAVFAEERRLLDVLVKVDTGLGRVGVQPGEPAVALARAVADAPGLRFAGVCAHEGGSYSIPDSAERERVTKTAVEKLVATARAIEAAGLPCERVSAGSTPGAKAAAGVEGVTELRPGNYAFYDTMQVGLGVVPLERCALRVLTSVISHGAADRAVIDAGSKVFSSDRGVHGAATAVGHGTVVGRPELTLRALSEEHGWLKVEPGQTPLRIGEKIQVVPTHSCPVANLTTELVIVRGEAVVDIWSVAARACVK